MARESSRSSRPDFFAGGGKTKMFGKGTAHAAESGVSGKQQNSGADGKSPDTNDAEGYGKGFRFPDGGTGKMFGKGSAGKKAPGVSGKESQSG